MIYKLLLSFFILSIFFINTASCQTASNSFVSIVNPIRGEDFWNGQEKPVDAVLGQIEIIKRYNLSASWLLRFDVLSDSQIQNIIKTFPKNQELGLFLEVTPTWTEKAGVEYRKSAVWHLAGSVFLSGYEPSEREKLIDNAFAKFKEIFSYYPKSVGAWWIDSYSLDYMQKKYGIDAALIVADQYSTDNYQIWGQYFGTPYYPYNKNALFPAQNKENKIPVVMTQWAVRDPINGYGEGVNETTYSVQANDYSDYHNLTSDYFSKLVDLYTNQSQNQFNYLITGLENSYSWKKYRNEYQKQIKILADKQNKGQFSVISMSDFASWYKNKFPDVSPEQIIIADDILGTSKKTVWYMNPYYRAGWFYNGKENALRDVRQYVEGQEEPCYSTACKQINFATFSTRVLDDVTYKQKLIIDEGQIKDFKVDKKDGNFTISYSNQAGKARDIGFLQRDISIDGKISSIDSLILNAQKTPVVNSQENVENISEINIFQETFQNLTFKLIKFLIFLGVALFIPGYILIKRIGKKPLMLDIFLSITVSFCLLTFISYISGLLKLPVIVYVLLFISLVFFIFKKDYLSLKPDFKIFDVKNILLLLIIISGTIFQTIALVRSGWVYDFGIGFFGPLGHDGIWHQALINQLAVNVPPVNPALSSEILTNYHYFFDLLLAETFKLTQIPVLDLLYRFYPVLFSLILGIGSYFICLKMLNNKVAVIISLFFIYFGSSFGWIIDLIKNREIGGESAFWMNQPVSANINPPFMISLLILICAFLVFEELVKNQKFLTQILLIFISGILIEFKVYAGIIILGSLFIVAVWQILSERKISFLITFLGSTLLSLAIFLPQNSKAGGLLIFSPFWFVHSMIDLSDRVGWERLSMGREAYMQRGDWLKLILAEVLGLIIFIVGNLGTRIIALPKIFTLFKASIKDKPSCLLLTMMIISIMIPILFIQKGNSWNTIQFAYYWLYFIAIFTGSAIIFIYKKIPKFISIPLILIIFFITPISSFATFKQSLSEHSPSRLGFEELKGLNFLNSLTDGVVLTYPFDKNKRSDFKAPYPLFVYETTSYVSAFSGKTTYLEDEMQQDILRFDYLKRLIASKEFFYESTRDLTVGVSSRSGFSRDKNDSVWSRDFLNKNNIKYIYLLKSDDVSLNEKDLRIKKVYDNKEVDIYEVLK